MSLWFGPLIAMLAPPLLVFAGQAILFRALPRQSAQALTAAAMLLGYFPYFALLGVLSFPWERDAGFYAYFFCLYSFAAYAYFHVFNMSETARRVRLLSYLGQRGQVSTEEVERIYQADDMTVARLERLVSLRQCSLKDGRYHGTGTLFPLVALGLFGIGLFIRRPWPAMARFRKTR